MPEVAVKEGYEHDGLTYRMPMLRSEVNILRRDVDGLKSDVAEVKRDISVLKSDVSQLKQDVRILQNDVFELKSDVKELRVQASDMKGEIRAFGARLDGMEKRIDDMHESQTKWFTLLGLLVAAVPVAVAIIQSLITK